MACVIILPASRAKTLAFEAQCVSYRQTPPELPLVASVSAASFPLAV